MRTVKAPQERTRVQTDNPDPKTKCVQSERKNSDINNIVAKAHQTGRLPVLMQRQPIPAMPDVESYQDAMNKVVFANQAFERLPSQIRAEFENSPAKMLAAIEQSTKNPELKEKLQKIGIIEPNAPLAEPLLVALATADSPPPPPAPPAS